MNSNDSIYNFCPLCTCFTNLSSVCVSSRKTGQYTLQHSQNGQQGDRYGTSASSTTGSTETSSTEPMSLPSQNSAIQHSSSPKLGSSPKTGSSHSPRHSHNSRSRPSPACQRYNSQVASRFCSLSVCWGKYFISFLQYSAV